MYKHPRHVFHSFHTRSVDKKEHMSFKVIVVDFRCSICQLISKGYDDLLPVMCRGCGCCEFVKVSEAVVDQLQLPLPKKKK